MIKLSSYAHWLLRFVLGSVFLYHGFGKLPNVQMIARVLNMPLFLVILVAVVEVMAGALVLFGGLFKKTGMTRIGALLIVPVMVGAIMLRWGQWSSIPSKSHPIGGIEFQVALLAIALYFWLKGNEA